MKNEQDKRQFKPGDTVRHADGIPMTVEGDPFVLDGRVLIPCVWFNGQDHSRRGLLDEADLFHHPGYAGMVNMRVPPLPPAREINAAMAAGAAVFENRRAVAEQMAALETGGGTIHPSILNRAELGQALYNAYGDQAGGKNFLGLPMPAWEDLPDHIRDCWEAVGTAAIRIIRTERR